MRLSCAEIHLSSASDQQVVVEKMSENIKIISIQQPQRTTETLLTFISANNYGQSVRQRRSIGFEQRHITTSKVFHFFVVKIIVKLEL